MSMDVTAAARHVLATRELLSDAAAWRTLDTSHTGSDVPIVCRRSVYFRCHKVNSDVNPCPFACSLVLFTLL